MDTRAPLHLALWQTAHPTPADGADSTAVALARLDAAAAEAAAGGAHWLLTPEMALTGYLIEPATIAARAEPADGPLLRAVAATARQHRLGIVTGWPEIPPGLPAGVRPSRPFNSAAAIDEHGTLRAVHRKIHLFGDADAQRFAPGTGAPADFDWRGWRLGLLICYDVEHDAPLAHLAARGAHAALVPTANMAGFDDVQHQRLPEAARRFGLALAYANACGHEGPTAYNGLSTAVDARGHRLALADRGEALLRVVLAP